MTSQQAHRAIISISVSNKTLTKSNYSRRMYAIIRRYTPDAVEGTTNECFAELTGLRTFFKMTYAELADTIRKDLTLELDLSFVVKVSTVKAFEQAQLLGKKTKTVSTYKEINSLFVGKSFVEAAQRKVTRSTVTRKKIRLVIPFLGKVA